MIYYIKHYFITRHKNASKIFEKRVRANKDKATNRSKIICGYKHRSFLYLTTTAVDS